MEKSDVTFMSDKRDFILTTFEQSHQVGKEGGATKKHEFSNSGWAETSLVGAFRKKPFQSPGGRTQALC